MSEEILERLRKIRQRALTQLKEEAQELLRQSRKQDREIQGRLEAREATDSSREARAA